MNWLCEYVGKPFAEGGRGPDAFDCWGLLMQVYQHRLGIALPMYDEIGTNDHRGVARTMSNAIKGSPWGRVKTPQAFDVMVARRGVHSRYPGHVGVMISDAKVLHVWPGRDVHTSRIKEPAVAGLVLGYFRHEAAPC